LANNTTTQGTVGLGNRQLRNLSRAKCCMENGAKKDEQTDTKDDKDNKQFGFFTDLFF